MQASDQEIDPRTEFVAMLRGYGRVPGVRLAAIAALIGAGVVLVAGLLCAAVLPDKSFAHIGPVGESDLVRETFAQAATTTLATVKVSVEGSRSIELRVAPLLFALFPLGGCALGSALVSRRTDPAMPSREQLAWGAATAVPFAILMVAFSLFAGTIDDQGIGLSPSEGSVFVLSLLWGAAGGLLGVAWDRRTELLASVDPRSPLGLALAAAREALIPLAASLVVLALVAVVIWGVQVVRDAAEARGERSTATALVDDVLFAGDLGVRYQSLGSGAELHLLNRGLLDALVAGAGTGSEGGGPSASEFLPIPLSTSNASDLIDAHGLKALTAGYRVFDYGDVLPAWAFAPLILVLMGLPALMAVYGGFAAARVNEAATPFHGAAWGATVGLTWAAVLAALNSLSQDAVFGQVGGDSLFVVVVLGGAALGALGGFAAAQSRRRG